MNEQRSPLGDGTSATMSLPDGRELGYAQYGLKDGAPIICFHGLPGSRLDFERFDESAKTVGARLISVDRPGVGLSSPHPGSTVLRHARDIENLTDSLGLKAYAVLGGSAGGPYSLACAHSLPSNKLKAAAVVCGPGTPDMGGKGMTWLNYLGFMYTQWIPPSVLRWYFNLNPGSQVHLSPEKHLELLRSHSAKVKFHEREKGLFNTEESIRLWMKTSRECFKNNMNGPVQDGYRLGSDWGFRMQDIRTTLPVYLWYGNFDTVWPVNHGEQIAARIGKNAHLRVRDETHGSMFVNQAEGYLGELVKCVNGNDDSTN